MDQKQTKKERKSRIALLILAAVLLFVFLASFVIGRYDVPMRQVLRILIGQILPVRQTWTDSMAAAVLNIRLPRILLACLVGCCLSAAGTAYQSVFQNPMAAPDILGASSGACFGAALAILLGFSRTVITVAAFLCSLLTIALVYLIASRSRKRQTVTILLAGVMVSSLFSAGTSYIKLVADPSNQLPAITYWLMGSLSGSRIQDIKFVILPMLLGLVPLLLLRWRINLLMLSEEEASAVGVNTGRLRLTVISCATLLTAASVSVSGMIGWIGLVIPHLCRRIVGSNCRHLIPASMIFGAVFMLLADNVSRNLLAVEIPIGILTAFIGAPFFISLMMRKGGHL